MYFKVNRMFNFDKLCYNLLEGDDVMEYTINRAAMLLSSAIMFVGCFIILSLSSDYIFMNIAGIIVIVTGIFHLVIWVELFFNVNKTRKPQ